VHGNVLAQNSSRAKFAVKPPPNGQSSGVARSRARQTDPAAAIYEAKRRQPQPLSWTNLLSSGLAASISRRKHDFRGVPATAASKMAVF
jgi:hypothetical protein